MATTYDKASLVMIPSGVKESKAYSIKPTDGSGDFTFSRGTDTATRVNASGLIEKERVNLLLQSNTFSTTWSVVTASVTGGQSGYNGSSDAWLLSKSGAYGRVEQSWSYTGILTYSAYLKSGTSNYGELTHSPSGAYVGFSLDDGTIVSQLGLIDAKITSVGGGWYRCSMTFNSSGVSTWRIIAGDVGSDTSGGTSGTIYIQDAMLNQGLVAQPYIETTTAAVYEGITDNLPRLDYSGGASCPSLLLEPSRTNLVTQSEYFGAWSKVRSSVSFNQATSPEGVQNATKLIEDTSLNSHYLDVNPNITFTDNVVYTYSCFFKSAERTQAMIVVRTKANTYPQLVFNLTDGSVVSESLLIDKSIEDYGNGWYRASITYDVSSGASTPDIYIQTAFNDATSYQGDGTSGIYIYGAQIEAGSYPTSYIPTYGTSASRAADFSSESDIIADDSTLEFNSGDDFTLFFDGSFNDVSSTSNMMMGGGKFSFGANYQSYFWVVNGGEIRLSGSSEAVMGKTFSFSILDDTRYKILAKRSGSTISFFVNGVKGTTSGSVSPDATFVLRSIGWSYSNGNYNVSGKMNQALAFSTALTDAECIALTTI